jgi:hypothetical protein
VLTDRTDPPPPSPEEPMILESDLAQRSIGRWKGVMRLKAMGGRKVDKVMKRGRGGKGMSSLGWLHYLCRV